MASSTAPEPCSTTRQTPCHAQPSTATRPAVNAEGLFEGRLRGNNGLPFLFDQADGGPER